MLSCCNDACKTHFCYVLSNTRSNYRRLEYGTCPTCGGSIFRDYRQFEDGSEIVKDYTGRQAVLTYKKWLEKLKNVYGSYSNQNVYYGDFKRKGNKLIQLRKNFNNEAEELGEVETRVYYG